jgi:hypothetical protein
VTLERREHGRGHSYRIDGEKVPGITTVLRGIAKPGLTQWAANEAGDVVVNRWDELQDLEPTERRKLVAYAHREVFTEASRRGTAVHKGLEQLAAGVEVDVPEPYVGLVDAYLRFVEEWQPRELLVERPVFSRRWRYAGTPDLIADLADGKRWLLDWKTGTTIRPEYALQLAAARYAEVVLQGDGVEVPVPRVDACGCVHLRLDGTYELRPMQATEVEWRVFLHAIPVAAWATAADDFKQRDEWVGDPMEPPAREEVTP